VNLHYSYFSVPNPLHILDKLLHPSRYQQQVSLRNKPVTVRWTRRAARELARRNQPLLIELQLYFTCVVKKRALFHDPGEIMGLEPIKVNQDIELAFRTVQAASCDPEEFARSFPVKQEFRSGAAMKMAPRDVLLDFTSGGWVADFSI